MPAWIAPSPIFVPVDLIEATGGSPLVAELLARRGISDAAAARAFLDPHQYTPAPPEDLPGMEIACRRIEQAIERQERIWVWGDFDVDGQTSTALLVSVLRSLGADPGYHIPVRARESHGVNIPNLQRILDSGADLLITCDTGITAHDALSYAKSKGLDVIVTDHHVLGETIPPALACLTPRLLPAGHPLESLPGVGVAYKLAEALMNRAGRSAEPSTLLDLVALGIVADVARQVQDARYLLQRGIAALRHTQRAGLRAVMELAEVNPDWLSEEHIGYAIAPRLNALGRLDDANPAVELLTTSDDERARTLALQLEALNARRQLLTSQVLQAAEKQIERDPDLARSPVLILAHPDWPAGILGIAASALVERYHRPAILLANPPGHPARGSARSIEGVDITACIAAQRDLLLSFGGHPMAAGLALDAERLPAFRRGLFMAVEKQLIESGGMPEAALQIDAELRLDEISLELVTDLERLAPFGPGNPPPVFAIRDLRAAAAADIGREKQHRLVTLEDRNGQSQKALWWNSVGLAMPEGWFDLACVLRASNFHGQREVQLEWLDFTPIAAAEILVSAPALEVVDHRNAPHPRALLEALRGGNLAIWAEGEARELLGGQDRAGLRPANTLAIWTAPPGRAELRAAIQAVQPQTIVLFGLPPETGDLQEFLKRLAGLAKFAMNQAPAGASSMSLLRLAAALAQRETAARIGLDWLAARGNLTFDLTENGHLLISPGPGKPVGDPQPVLARLKAVLDESAAYRQFFRNAEIQALGIEPVTATAR